MIVVATCLVIQDVMIANNVTMSARQVNRALPVTQLVTTITQQKAKSPVVTLRLGVIRELLETLKSYILLRRTQALPSCNYIYRLCIDVDYS